MLFFKRFSFLLFLLFFAIQSFSQDIGGEWLGEVYMKNKKGEYIVYIRVYFEINHDTVTNQITGANVTKSGDTVSVDCTIEGVYDVKRKVYSLIESKAIDATPKKALQWAVLNIFNVTLSKIPEEILEGTCKCIDPIKHPLCFEDLKVSLRRYKDK